MTLDEQHKTFGVVEQKIRKPLVSALCTDVSQSPFLRLLQRVGMMKLSCVTPTQQQKLLMFCSQSTAISVAPASVFLCRSLHTHTHTHISVYVLVSSEIVNTQG